MDTPASMIGRARTHRRIRLREVAAATGLSVPHLSDMEHGRRPVTPSRAITIGHALGIVGDELDILVRAAVFAMSGLTSAQWDEYITS